ncbi:hypothetical protein CEXT_415841 [Caerostris extrusa]|uniref:Uncharacterized protein n=1 Tax=Caerostris extrusa TaxID=172846 RepID=A0AAV4MFA9_CAEEX|nr:hypothetical protein CEXT_415841 [Caerostris extrusa]
MLTLTSTVQLMPNKGKADGMRLNFVVAVVAAVAVPVSRLILYLLGIRFIYDVSNAAPLRGANGKEKEWVAKRFRI